MKKRTRRSFLQSSVLGVPGMMGMAGALPAAEPGGTAPGNQESDAKPAYQLSRRVPIDEGFDLVVAGGGPAGTAAAICAARLGAKVLLVEATGCLGGMGTSAMVSQWSNLSDGVRPVIGGLMAIVFGTVVALRGDRDNRGELASWSWARGGSFRGRRSR